MKLGLRLGLIYLAVAFIFLVAVFSAMRTFTLVSGEARTLLEKDAAALRHLSQLRVAFDSTIQATRLATVGATSFQEAQRHHDTARQLLQQLQEISQADERRDIAYLQATWDDAFRSLQKIQRNRGDAKKIFDREVLPSLTSIGRLINRLEYQRAVLSHHRIGKIQDSIQQARIQLSLYVFSLVIVAAALVYFIIQGILLPLRRLQQATATIAEGDFNHRVPVKSQDEMGDLSRGLNAMAARLAESEKTKMEFLSMVSHEMRTPLTLIRVYASRLQNAPPADPQRQKKDCEIIVNETKQLQFLVDDLLDAARAEIGVFRIEPVPTQTARFLTSLLEPFERQAEKKNILFSYDFTPLPPSVLDGKRIGQALRNLVANAFKFTPEGGRVWARGYEADGNLIFEVSDTGPGIPPEELPHVFTRFYQVSTRRNNARSGFGLGLGLAIVREIAKAHGGDVEAQSEVGKGTLFRVKIPHQPFVADQTADQREKMSL